MNKEERDRYITRAQSEPLTMLTELGSFLWGMLVGVGWLVAFVGGLLFILNLL